MTFRRSLLPVIALVAVAVGLSGCTHFKNPFASNSHSKYTGKGERIPVIVYDTGVKPAAALKGVSFSLPDPQPIGDWPVPGGTPAQSVENPASGRDFVIAWRSHFGVGSNRAAQITAPPVAAAGRIFVMDGFAGVSAYDAQSGRVVWHKDMAQRSRRNRDAFGGGLAYAEGRLFVASGYRFIAALDAATGAVIWRTPVEAPIHAAPTVADGRIFVESVDDNLMTFDAATGAPGWAYQALAEPARILAATSPAVTSDAVVASFASGELVAMQPANGTGLWSAVLSKSNRNSALSEIRDIPGRPVIYKGSVYAISHSGVFAAIDLRTGAVRWELPLTGLSSPWAAGDVVYVTDSSGVLVCVSLDSGQVYWTVDLNKGIRKPKDRAVWSGPMLASNRLIVVSSKGDARALNPKTGALEKTLKLGSDALMNPIAVGDDLYVATQAAELIAIR